MNNTKKIFGKIENYIKNVKTNEQIEYQVFDLLFNMMLGAGGDGDCALLCDNWKSAADKFEKWANTHCPNFFNRINNDDSVVFQGNGIGTQESITITKYDKIHPNWIDCVIKTLQF